MVFGAVAEVFSRLNGRELVAFVLFDLPHDAILNQY